MRKTKTTRRSRRRESVEAGCTGHGHSGVWSRRVTVRPRFGSTRRWRRLRALVLARDGHRCATCGRYGNDVDHIVPRCMGGPDVPSNLRVRCAHCNRTDGGKLGARIQQAHRHVWPGAIDLEA